MADTITTYEGNANLGAGSNANIPSPTDVRLFEGSNQAMNDAFKTINDTHKTIALMNFEFNQKIFAQKVKDRDTLMDMLDKGEAVIGNYRKEDKKYLDEAKKKYNEKFDIYYNKGINDEDSMREFREAAMNLKDVGTKLGMRYDYEQKENAAIAAETISAKKEMREKNKEESLNGDINNPPKPYQQTLDFNPYFNNPYSANALVSGSGGGDVPHGTSNIAAQSSISTPATSTSQRVTTTKQAGKPDKVVTITAPAKEAQQKGVEPIQGSIVTDANGMVYSVSKKYYDWNIMKGNATTEFINKFSQDHEMQVTLHRYMETQPKEVVEQHLKDIAQRVNDYNHDRGFDESDKKNYLDYGSIEKIATIDPETGRYIINPKISIPEFAALDALAQVQGSYVPEQRSFLPDETKAMQAAQKEKDEFLLKKMEGEQAIAKSRVESALTEGREIDKEKRMGNALLISANGIDRTAKEHGQVVTETGGIKKINLALTDNQRAAFATAGKTTDVTKELEGDKTETTTETQAKKIPDLLQKNPDGTYTVIHYKRDDKGKIIQDIHGKSIDEELTHVISKESYLQGLASTIYDKKDQPIGFASALTQMNEDKKTIKKSDISSKAEAAGYSVKEYEKLLKEKGIKIKD